MRLLLDTHTLIWYFPRHHNAPFDRLIISQAIVEGISIICTDTVFDPYPVQRLW